LGLAEYFFVTGDSISMVSECCATGKGVFIYAPTEIMSTKHLGFVNKLCAQGYAMKLSKEPQILTFKPQLVLMDTASVAQKITKTLI
jgi:mitochondrial fission protein ELM1